MEDALEQLRTGDPSGAIARFTDLLTVQPHDPMVVWYLGLAWLLQGDAEQAQAIWLEGISLDDAIAAETHIDQLLAVLKTETQFQHRTGRIWQATIMCQQWIELAPEDPHAYAQLGNLWSLQGNLDGAIEAWQTAVEWIANTDSESLALGAVLYQRLAETHMVLQDYAGAIASFQALLTLTPPTAEIYIQLGHGYGHMGDWEAATQSLEQALKIPVESQAQHSEAWGDLGYAYLQLGALDRAIACWKTAFSLQPQYVQSWQHHWQTSPPCQPFDHLMAAFVQTLTQSPSKPEVYLSLGQGLRHHGLYPLAIAALEQALPLQTAAVFVALCQTLWDAGEYNAAQAIAQEGLSHHPQHVALWIELGRSQAATGDATNAIAHYQHALQLDSSITKPYQYLGNSYLQLGDWDAARSAFQTYVKTDPQAVDAWFNLAIAQLHLRDESEAITSFQTVLRLNSNVAPKIWEAIAAFYEQELISDLEAWEKIIPVDTPEIGYPSTQAWVNQARQLSSYYLPIHPAETIALKRPNTSDPEPHTSFRFPSTMPLPESFVSVIPNGRFWIDPDQSSTAVLTAENALLADLSPEFPILSPDHPKPLPEQHWTFRAGKLPPFQAIEGTVAVLAGLSNHVYFHWMLDIVPRVELLANSGIELEDIDYFLVSDRHSFQQESLQKLGIPTHKILPLDRHSHIQATSLIVPSYPGAVAWMPAWVFSYLQDIFLPQNDTLSKQATSFAKRLYISRSKTSNRRVVNEPELLQILKEFGFTEMTLESLSISEQAMLFANADVIVAPHGSGLTNLAFCRPNTTVIELFSPDFVYPCYWLLSNLVGLNYSYVLGTKPEGHFLHRFLHPNPRIEDIYIDPIALKAVLTATL
ncbi:tetratricopeptide repeat protein [Leptolyngbya sp. AN02str]|uniref:tetratricopeptide repeat protein n=1 Tax=Leptolyngbya sp. AN02str TaxID=3423363 RepID=UPI003D3232BE